METYAEQGICVASDGRRASARDEGPAESPGRDPDIVTTKQLAALLGLTPLTIQRLRDNGVISYMDTGGVIRYSYSQVKNDLTANAERRRAERLARKQQDTVTRVTGVAEFLDAEFDKGDLVTAHSVAQRFGIGVKAAKGYLADAAAAAIERHNLVSRRSIAEERVLDPRNVHSLLHLEEAPNPVLQVGRTLYYRRAEVFRFLDRLSDSA